MKTTTFTTMMCSLQRLLMAKPGQVSIRYYIYNWKCRNSLLLYQSKLLHMSFSVGLLHHCMWMYIVNLHQKVSNFSETTKPTMTNFCKQHINLRRMRFFTPPCNKKFINGFKIMYVSVGNPFKSQGLIHVISFILSQNHLWDKVIHARLN